MTNKNFQNSDQNLHLRVTTCQLLYKNQSPAVYE
jgi:hypothetical protein